MSTCTSQTGSIVAAIRATAAQFPDKVALRDVAGELSYTDMMQQADAMARGLLRQGVIPGDRVAILMGQGKAAVVASLGVLAAGARFVPLDASDAAERLQFIIDDCQPRLTISDRTHAAAVQAAQPGRPVMIDAEITATQGNTGDLPPTDGESPAYIFYTSGSTGNPKGVCQNHRNLLHFSLTYAGTLEIGPQDRLSMLYSMHFSASNMDIFGGLLSGATVCFYDLKHRGSTGLDHWLEDEHITVLHTVPSVFRHLLHHTSTGHVYRQVRAIDLGGEAVYNSDIPLIKTFFTPECRCFNHLAATEASVIAQHLVDTGRSYTRGLLPVGPTAAGMQVRILRPDGNDAAPGETGELVLYSDFLSTGYWNLPEQTARAFGITLEGKRFYRSGDLGIIDEQGELNYVGRNDFRIKINGQTIEPGEIEAALLGIEGIDEAVVIAWQREPGIDPQLLAFYLANNGAPEARVLRKRLLQQLPPYMVPAHLIRRERLALTSTGKIDRKQLQPLPGELAAGHEAIEAPQGETEQHVARLFASLLKTANPDRRLTFFEQGGSSLQAMNLVQLLEKNYRVNIPLELINRDASIAAIAAHLEYEMQHAHQHTPAAQSRLMMPLIVHDRPRRLFLVHGRDGHAMISPDLGRQLSAHHDLYVMRARGLQHGERPNTSIEGMAAEYIHEIRQVQPEGPYYLAGLCAGSIIALEMARQLQCVGEAVKPVIVFDPPLRAPNSMTVERRRELVRDMHRQLQEYRMEDYQDLAQGLAKRIRDGKIDLDLNDEKALGATAHVVIGMNIAMNTYLPHHPYPGKVLIICSKDRFDSKRRFGDTLISGKLVHFIVGKNHNDVLDAKNPNFVAALQKCMEIVLR